MKVSKPLRPRPVKTAAAVQQRRFVVAPTPQPAPAARADPGAIAALLDRGYSDTEIYSLVVPKRTLARRQALNEALTVEETDKALRLERIADLADRVFGERDKAQRWLRKGKRQLNGETPVAFLASEAGARLVEEMLTRIDQGIFA